MPVLLTGIPGSMWPHAVAAFAHVSPEVRAYVPSREAAHRLRSVGAKAAVGRIDDTDTLAVAMEGVHTVCHLDGPADPEEGNPYRGVETDSITGVLEVSSRTGVRRLLYLSYPGADPGSENSFLRLKGAAEAAIGGSGIEHVIVRCTHVYGPGSRWIHALEGGRRRWWRASAVLPGPGSQVVAPVFVEDVAAVLAAADDRERVVSGVWGLEGPDRVTADDLTLMAMRAGGHGPSTAAGSRWHRRRRPRDDADEIWSAGSLADRPDAAAEFGVTLTPLAEGLARSLPA